MAISETVSVGWTPASVLVNATGDAMSNIFDILIDWPWDTGAGPSISSTASAEASYRADGFDVPQPKTDTYDVTWLGVKVKKVASGVNLERTFKLTFRLDANYALYQKFLSWQKLTTDVNTSGVSNTESALGRIQVVAPGAEYNSMSWSVPSTGTDRENLVSQRLGSTKKLVWTFEDVQCINVGQPKFKNEQKGNAMKYEVNFTFGDVEYPFYSTATNVQHNHKQSS